MSTTENLRALNDCAFRNMGVSILGGEGRRSDALQILVAEDDAADLYLLKAALADNPRVADVVVAKDGIEALEMLDSGAIHPDLAIIDLHMPRKDGLSLLLELRTRSEATFPAIVLTSSRSAADAMRSRNRGAELFLVKPEGINKLTALMDDVISVL